MSFERFKLNRDMKDEARELSAAGRAKQLAGSVGAIGGAMLLPFLLNPATLVGGAVAAGVGSLVGNVAGRHLFAPKATKILEGEDKKFYGDERDEFQANLNTSMMTDAITTALTAGGSEFLKTYSKVPGQFNEEMVKQATDLGIEGVKVGDKVKLGQRIQLAGGPKLPANPLSKEGVVGSKMIDDKGFFRGGEKDRVFGRVRDKIDLKKAGANTTKPVSKPSVQPKVNTKISSKNTSDKSVLDNLWNEVKGVSDSNFFDENKLSKLRNKEINRIKDLLNQR